MLQNGGWVLNEADMTEDFLCAVSVLGNPQTAVPCRIDAAAANDREMGDVVRREVLSDALVGEHTERGTYPSRASGMYPNQFCD